MTPRSGSIGSGSGCCENTSDTTVTPRVDRRESQEAREHLAPHILTIGVEGSTLVTAMARNGVEFGLRVAGTGDQWFTAPVGPADGLFFPGYSIEDANPDL
ncbi:MAG: DUF1116 domain-containing protein, partial [Ornithinibacter sp.]